MIRTPKECQTETPHSHGLNFFSLHYHVSGCNRMSLRSGGLRPPATLWQPFGLPNCAILSSVMTQRAAIKAIKSFLPEQKLTNEQLAEQFGDWHASQILSKTGVAVRGVAGSNECASDLGVKAAQRLFESGACAPDEIDFLIFCTQSPDYFTPTTACVMQDALGLPTSCGAIDINQGCSGYIYGLALAKSLVEAGTAKTVLLVTADTYMKFINRRDRSLLTLFGDGAAATLIRAVDSERELIGPFVLGSDGRGATQIMVKAGGLRCRSSAETAIEKEDSAGNWRSD